MGLTSALFTGLSGLSANSQLINVTGNNISNVNTTGFKASRVSFQTQISQQLSQGSPPSGTLGGTNPTQIGLGTRMGSITRNFTTGNVSPTGVNTDMAIEGNGFFVLNYGSYVRYSRDGNFSLDRDFNLVNSTGGRVQGYGVDANFNVIEGVLGDVNIPIGAMTLAQATQHVRMGGNLNAGGVVATQGSLITSAILRNGGGAGPLADGATALTSLYADGGATPLFAVNDLITVTGATKGSATIPIHTFRVGASAGIPPADDFGTTLQDFADFLRDILGVDTTVGTASVSITGGQITIEGNTGTVNDIVLDSGNIICNLGSSPTQPFLMTKSQSANGESVRTSFVAYDSLGNPVNIDMAVVLDGKDSTGTQWRFYIQSEDDSRLSRAVSNGTLAFDNNGRLADQTGQNFSLYRDGTGALSPQAITLNFTGDNGSLSALRDTVSSLSSLSQDGSPIGTLQDFSVGGDGTITGVFSNSLLRPLGRVVLATFTNPQGLVENGANLFSESVNSGAAQVHSPGTGGAGRMVGAALELSNVDLSQEFINLISASTGFSAASRVLTTSDRLIQDLIATIR